MSPALTKLREMLAATVLLAVILAPHLSGQAAPLDSAETHLGKGYDALKQDRYEVAAQEFRAALALDPSLVLRAQFPLAVSLFEQHKSAEARREFEAVRREIGDHPNISYYSILKIVISRMRSRI
jgi:TolA-binding protein